jgi:hypothetical protein
VVHVPVSAVFTKHVEETGQPYRGKGALPGKAGR